MTVPPGSVLSGLVQYSMVLAVAPVGRLEGEALVITSSTPSKSKPLPTLPGVYSDPVIVPVFSLPEVSLADVPWPSSKSHLPTGPVQVEESPGMQYSWAADWAEPAVVSGCT